MKSKDPNVFNAADDYLAANIRKSMNAFSNRNQSLRQAVRSADSLSELAKVTAQEVHAHFELKRLHETLSERILLIEETLESSNPSLNRDLLSSRLAYYQELEPTLSRILEQQETNATHLKLKYFELQTAAMGRGELTEQIEVWASRAKRAKSLGKQDLAAYATQCEELCRTAIVKIAP